MPIKSEAIQNMSHNDWSISAFKWHIISD